MNPTAPDSSTQQFRHPSTDRHSIDLIRNKDKQRWALCSLSGDDPHILNKPIQLFCGHRVCKWCLETAFLKQDQFYCPATTFSAHSQNDRCGQLVTTSHPRFIDIAGETDINGLLVSCAFASEGCLWQGKYGHYATVHVVDCEQGKKRFLADTVASLQGLLASKQAEINTLVKENSQLREKGVESQQTIARLKETVTLRDRKIEELNRKLADSECQRLSTEEIIRLLSDEISALKLAANHSEPQASALPVVAAQSAPKLAKNPASVPVEKKANVQNTQASAAGAAGGGSQMFWIRDDEIFSPTFTKVSRTFELGGTKGEFLFGKSYRYSPIGLFFRLHGDSGSAGWPCAKTMTFTLKELNGNGKDVVRSVHFPRTPAQCKDNPGDKPGAAVGFREFCPEDVLEYNLDRRKPNFFNSDGLCQVEVVVRDTKLDEVAGPAYELDYRSVGLHWPVRDFRSRINASETWKYRCSSPLFLTAENGYQLSLTMDVNGTYVPGKHSTSIKAVLEENRPHHLAWPLKGVLFIRLLDRNAATRQDVELMLPVEFNKPAPRMSYCSSKAESSEVEFFKKRLLSQSESPDKPCYLAHNEIVIEASFLPE